MPEASDLLGQLPAESARLLAPGSLRAAGPQEIKRIQLESKAAAARHTREEKAKDGEARRALAAAAQAAELRERQTLFYLSVFLVPITAVACLLFLSYSGDADLRKWAMNMLNTLVTGFLAFTMGRRGTRRKTG